MMIAFYQL